MFLSILICEIHLLTYQYSCALFFCQLATQKEQVHDPFWVPTLSLGNISLCFMFISYLLILFSSHKHVHWRNCPKAWSPCPTWMIRVLSPNSGNVKRFLEKTWNCGKMKCTGSRPSDSWRYVRISASQLLCLLFSISLSSLSLHLSVIFRPSVSICPEGICASDRPSMKWSFMNFSKLIMRYFDILWQNLVLIHQLDVSW